MEWAKLSGQHAPTQETLREIYQSARSRAESGELLLFAPDVDDPFEAGIEFELGRIADEDPNPDADLEGPDYATVAGLQDALRAVRGQSVPRRPDFEPTVREVADDYLKLWRTQHGLKETNTEQQKVATYDLFGGFWGARPIRDVRKKDAAAFVDALRQMDPLWARSSKARAMTWAQLQAKFGGRARGMTDATINRHMATLKSLWAWAQERDHCDGNNPFSGFHRKLKNGRNVQGYQPWEADELKRLFDPAPKRADVQEIMLVAMYSGMRLDEIASLTRGQVMQEAGVPFVQVVDAKTPAGIRRVPLHPALSWLVDRAKGKLSARLWPGFNEEGPGKKAGADAGKEFSRFKLSRGFADRQKAFHSFRKNFVGQLEAKGVPQNEAALIVGHERGFTFGTYGQGISLQRMAEVVALVDYPGLTLPAVS
ncbi:tyrosine-type recombinase/integrase [Novosphingobium sp.]|uniref:tyrosine-type recombinase/integrase n=1 Tax=Novosphingobium sp. TaxID=1874826 RepID=UPI002636BDAE|nr:site-specific integrase [Novosphingobium sp.]